jgi:AraC family transcriptional regulator
MDMRNRWANADGEPSASAWEPPAPPEPEPLSVVLSKLLDGAMQALDVDPEQSRVLLRRAAMLLHSGAVLRDLAVRAPPRAALAPRLARLVARHVEDNLDRSLPLGELARLTGLSNSYFSRAFKGAFGETPHAFILRRRVARARAEMLGTEEPLAQIALTCGFADQAHLARIFRRETGSAPSAWRLANRRPIEFSGERRPTRCRGPSGFAIDARQGIAI